jgi:predicted glycoside hydrolase/deacetylase ChbG (UPF0249 family)
VKRLLVTADDVGLHEGMTLGAIRAHRRGIVTACSVAATGPALDHAVEQLTGCPDLDVGVHLVVADGYRRFAARYFVGGVALPSVEASLRAQIERVLGRGLPVRHLNGHQHLHVLPSIFEIVVRLAREYGVGYVRVPDDRPRAGWTTPRHAAVRILGRFARRAAAVARAAGVRTNDHSLGILDAGHLTAARLVELTTAVNGTAELVTHPGIDGAAIGRVYRWRYAWDDETAALCDDSVRAALAGVGVALTDVRTLLATPA